MGIVKILNCGDFHDHEEMYTLDATVELANKLGVHGLVYCGDLQDAKKHVPEFLAEKEKYKEEIQKIEESKQRKTEEGLSEQEREDLSIEETMKQLGGPKGILNLLQQNLPKEDTQKLMSFFKQAKTRAPYVQEAVQKKNQLVADELKAEQEIEKICLGPCLEKMAEFYSKANEKIGQIKAEKIFIRGNHDIDSIYDMVTNAHFLERDGLVNLGGLRIAGAPNTNEGIPNLAAKLFEHMVEDEFIESSDQLKQIPEEALKNLPVYQRLKDEEIDYLVTHKGLDEFAGGHGFGAGLAQIVQEKKPPIIVSGHVHSYMYSDEHGYEGLRIGPKTAVVTHVDTETKEIEQLDIYERVGAT